MDKRKREQKSTLVTAIIATVFGGIILTILIDGITDIAAISVLLNIWFFVWRFLNIRLALWWVMLVLGILALCIWAFHKRTTKKNKNTVLHQTLEDITTQVGVDAVYQKNNGINSCNQTQAAQPSLDFVTLAKFMMTDSKVKALDDFIRAQPNKSMLHHDDEMVNFYLMRLHWVGIYTLEDLLHQIETHYDFIMHFTKIIYGTSERKEAFSQPFPGKLIYYICYCVIFQEQSVNKILNFWEIGGNKTTSAQSNQAAQFLSIYNEYYKNNNAKDNANEVSS